MRLEETNLKKLKDNVPQIGLIPAGSTEQHGPHAPFGTDSIIAQELAKKAESKKKEEVLLFPTIKIGISQEHSNFPGTIHVSTQTFRNYLKDIIKSATKHGTNKYIIVNGHGGNENSIQELCQELYHEEKIKAINWTWWNSLENMGDLGHAGELETSLIKYLKPELINEPLPKGSDSWGRKIHGATIDYDTSNFSENGFVGNPSNSNKEKGEKIFKEASKELINLINKFKSEDIV